MIHKLLDYYRKNPKDDLDLLKADLDAAGDLPLDAIKLIQNQIQLDQLTIKARVRIWNDLEKKLKKRINYAKRQILAVKQLVSRNQQAEINLRTDFDQIGDEYKKQVGLRIATDYNVTPQLNASTTQQSQQPQPLQKQSISQLQLSPRESQSSEKSKQRMNSPGAIEQQLKLDLIDEEENIDEFLKGTQNFWIKDVQQNEDNYDRQEMIGLEDEKIELIAQCAKLEHDIDFMKRLQKVGKQFN